MVGGMRADRCDDTCCESFRQEREDQASNSFNDHPCQTISIDCEAVKCVYNTNYKCHAAVKRRTADKPPAGLFRRRRDNGRIAEKGIRKKSAAGIDKRCLLCYFI